jgi:hypothetical protein
MMKTRSEQFMKRKNWIATALAITSLGLFSGCGNSSPGNAVNTNSYYGGVYTGPNTGSGAYSTPFNTSGMSFSGSFQSAAWGSLNLEAGHVPSQMRVTSHTPSTGIVTSGGGGACNFRSQRASGSSLCLGITAGGPLGSAGGGIANGTFQINLDPTVLNEVYMNVSAYGSLGVQNQLRIVDVALQVGFDNRMTQIVWTRAIFFLSDGYQTYFSAVRLHGN